MRIVLRMKHIFNAVLNDKVVLMNSFRVRANDLTRYQAFCTVAFEQNGLCTK